MTRGYEAKNLWFKTISGVGKTTRHEIRRFEGDLVLSRIYILRKRGGILTNRALLTKKPLNVEGYG